jgi:hypothetical protein
MSCCCTKCYCFHLLSSNRKVLRGNRPLQLVLKGWRGSIRWIEVCWYMLLNTFCASSTSYVLAPSTPSPPCSSIICEQIPPQPGTYLNFNYLELYICLKAFFPSSRVLHTCSFYANTAVLSYNLRASANPRG